MGLFYARYGKEEGKHYWDFSCFNFAIFGWLSRKNAVALIVHM